MPAYLETLRGQDRSKNLLGNSNRLDASKAMDRETAVIENESPIAIAINWAISLGGDTRSNGCIAGALAGAYWGDEHIPDEWLIYCEGTADARLIADQLYSS
jgi:ADP-ribosylglycohydrolase